MCHLPLTPTHDQHFPPEGTFSPTGEPTLTRHYYMTSWCWVFYVFVKMCKLYLSL